MENIKEWAILDSGATSHFLVTGAPTSGMTIATNPISVTIPDGSQVQSTHTCTVAIPELPDAARIGHIIPGLASHSLLSVVKLCNAGCEVSCSKVECIVKYRGRIVLRGRKCSSTGLWMVPLDTRHSPTKIKTSGNEQVPEHIQIASFAHEFLGNLIPTSSQEELAMYYHQCLCSPPKSSMLKAIRNNQLASFPGLTYELISKHLPPSSATEKGHMVRTRQGARSTRSNQKEILDARKSVDDMHPQEQICNTSEDEMFCFAILADSNDATIYSDLAGRFPVRSYSGMNYIFVAYVYSINAILIRPMQSRSDECMVATFKDVYGTLKGIGLHPKLHVLDNECSKAVQEYVR